MSTNPSMKKPLAMMVTAIIIALVAFVAIRNKDNNAQAKEGEAPGPYTLTPPKKDWPVFGGHLQRNFVNPTVKGLPAEWDLAEGTNIKWSTDLGSLAYGGPIVADGKIFIGTNNNNPRDPQVKGDKGIIMCFNEKDGKFLWQAVHDKLPAGRVHDWPNEGICSSPAVDGDRLYYISNRCELVAADVNGDGKGGAKIYWTLDMIGKLNVFPHNLATSSPLIVGDTIFLVTSNGVDEKHLRIPSPKAPSFLAVNKKDGSVLWSRADPGLQIMHGQWSSPTYAEPNGEPQIIFPGGDGWIYAFNPKDGELLWKFNCNPKNAVYRLGGTGTKNDFIATPVVYKDKLYIGVGQDPEHDTGVGHLWCIDITKKPKNKEKDLSPVNDNFDPKAEVNKDSGLVWHYGGPVKEGDKNITERNYHFGRSMSTCSIKDDLLYVADFNGWVFCMDANTGKVHWAHDMFAATWCSTYLVDDKVYIGNEDGMVLVFKHGKEKELLAEIDMGVDKVRTTAVAANGTLYLMTENPTKLLAISKKK